MSAGTTQVPAGRPRLVVSYGEAVVVDDVPAEVAVPNEVPLLDGTMSIGSGPGNDLRLDGLDEMHAAVVRAPGNKYVVVDRSYDSDTRVNGRPVSSRVEDGHPLRAGDRVEVGPWTLSYRSG